MQLIANGGEKEMVKIENKVVELLKDRELKCYQAALNTNDQNEISHWEKVIRSREAKKK